MFSISGVASGNSSDSENAFVYPLVVASTSYLLISPTLSFTFGRYKPGGGRNAKIKMKVRMQKRAEMVRGN